MPPGRSQDPEDDRLDSDEADIRRAAQRLRGAKRILAITGAGLSADSGLPTYRGVGGLYAGEVATPGGLSVEEILSGPMFDVRPDVTWNAIREIERNCRGAKPNRGHEVLAEMESVFDAVWILTQNVDGLHAAAGSRKVLDIHGDLHEVLCKGCGYRARVEDYRRLDELPRCPDCASVLRPDVVLFGEWLDPAKLARMEAEMAKGFDVVFSIGTSSLFDYVAAPVRAAHADGKPTIEINPEATQISDLVCIKIRGRASTALDRIWAHFRGDSPGD